MKWRAHERMSLLWATTQVGRDKRLNASVLIDNRHNNRWKKKRILSSPKEVTSPHPATHSIYKVLQPLSNSYNILHSLPVQNPPRPQLFSTFPVLLIEETFLRYELYLSASPLLLFCHLILPVRLRKAVFKLPLHGHKPHKLFLFPVL